MRCQMPGRLAYSSEEATVGRAEGQRAAKGRAAGRNCWTLLLLSGQLPASRCTWAPSQATFPWPQSLGTGRSPMCRACHHEGSPKSPRLPAWSQANNSSPHSELREAGERALRVINSSTSCRRGKDREV